MLLTRAPLQSRLSSCAVNGDQMDPTALLNLAEDHYQFFVFVCSTFVIFMGVVRSSGKRDSYQRVQMQRRKMGLPVATLTSTDGGDASFSTSSALAGGLAGIYVVAILCSYVLLMLGFFYGFIFVGRSLGFLDNNEARLVKLTSILMWYPVIMLSSFLLIQVVQANLQTKGRIGAVFIGFILLAVLAITALFATEGEMLAAQTSIVAVLALCQSYMLGLADGARAADPEEAFQRVSVQVLNGDNLEEAWLYERTDSDYRLLTKEGSNHVIPAANVKEIRDL